MDARSSLLQSILAAAVFSFASPARTVRPDQGSTANTLAGNPDRLENKDKSRGTLAANRAACLRLPTAEYRPRKPQDTLLHRLVREHLATFVAYTEATYPAPLPRYVKDAFERYLACGDFCRGFVRCHCDACQNDLLVAFRCKQRGLCPSCGARRMCDVAANVTDAILPSAPVRQWVLSLPFELRGLAATKPDVLTALAASSSRRSSA